MESWANKSEELIEEIKNVEIQPEGEDVTKADLSYMKKILRTHLIESKNNVEVFRKDPKSPLYSVKSFEELRLSDELLKGLYEMGFQKPSKIQETVLPVLIANPPTNIIAQSQSGTGKTAAFLLSSLKRVNIELEYPQVLILSPTFELALQTAEVAKKMAKFTKTTFRHVVKGEARPPQRIKEHVIIGTPGKMVDWALRFRAFDLKKINVFILDEADVMIDTQGHGTQSIKLQKELRSNCQMMLFSATYDEEVMKFAETIIPDALIIQLKREEESLENITQYYVVCKDENDKYIALANIFGTVSIGQTFIFCHTKRSANALKTKLEGDGHAVSLITGDLSVEERTDILKRFKNGDERVLITTNLMARGIDVEQVTVVINYDLPINMANKDIDFETYLHRIGRTGRFGKSGLAINLIDSDRTMGMIRKLEDHFGRKIVKLDAFNVDEIEKIQVD
ncbi:hypothetical protein RND71_044240 [Anisodus tanguticus]|uniref:RNA helicase n=1 Tax=Anisodus tanguticus TaxID=243964 RepID=A0AAE1QMK1_9SOLA|nr:hypothetical protein RND71_044240 [Anisodus tanguticus]